MTQQKEDNNRSGEHTPDPRDWLAAIIEGSEDAIISKDLTGQIQSWNPGATRLFGYEPAEVIGQPITILIPEDRLEEEPRIISAIRNGRRVEHFETVRRRKDGSLVDLSLSISPIRNSAGTIVGASKIARDISERRLAEERQQLLLGEMRHRVKNLFAVASAIVSITGRSEDAPHAAIQAIHDKLQALAHAHEMTMAKWDEDSSGEGQSDLISLIQIVLKPYQSGEVVTVEGDLVPIRDTAATHLALLFYELATNSAKYGALSVLDGQLVVRIHDASPKVHIVWEEIGAPPLQADAKSGFGSLLEKSLAKALAATVHREWRTTGLFATVELELSALQ